MRILNESSIEQSRTWINHFLRNTAADHRLRWDDSYRLSEHERGVIERSIQQFQLGEGSHGRRLLKRGFSYSAQARDPYFTRALYLFIQEEQRHSAHLLRFMEQQGIRAVSKHWVDSVFRRLRGLAGLELSLRVLVTAEIIAVPYYRALGRATKSSLLRALSARILVDEAAHLRFQASMLRRVASMRFALPARMVARLHRLFLIATVCVVWREHRGVFEEAGYCFRRLLRESLSEFAALDRASAPQRVRADDRNAEQAAATTGGEAGRI
jgi:hypothetical protein